jgi:hypothetical protein
MFMTDAPNPETPQPRAAPHKDRPTGTGARPSVQLLSLVHRLIAFGRQLVATLRDQPESPAAQHVGYCFGTFDLAAIIARITSGLRLAAALEQRIIRNADRLDAKDCRTAARPDPARTPPQAKPADAATNVVRLPSSAAIARQVRNRPIGEVLADICRDLGITPSHPLWRELHLAITGHGGNYARLVIGLIQRIRISDFDMDPVPPRLPGAPQTLPATGPP